MFLFRKIIGEILKRKSDEEDLCTFNEISG